MMRRTAPKLAALPVIKLGALAVRQASKPIVKHLIGQAKHHPSINTLCIFMGRVQYGMANLLFRMNLGEGIKSAAVNAKKSTKSAEDRLKQEVEGQALTDARKNVEDFTKDIASGGSDLNAADPAHRVSVGHYKNHPPTHYHYKTVIKPGQVQPWERYVDIQAYMEKKAAESAKQKRLREEATVPKKPTPLNQTPLETEAHDAIDRKKAKQSSKRLDYFGAKLGRPIATRVKRTLNNQHDRFFKPVPNDVLRDAGAELIVEMVAYTIAACILWYEYEKSAASAKEKEERVAQRILELEEKVNQLAAKHPSIDGVVVGGVETKRRRWFW